MMQAEPRPAVPDNGISDPPATGVAALPVPVPPPPENPPNTLAGFEIMPDTPPQGLFRRLITVHRHLFALLFGAIVAHTQRGLREGRGRGFRLFFLLERLIAWLVRPFLDRTLRDQPFPVQLRRRLEILGPTYIKLGQ
ncbi:MAG TPA: hypothetical protein VF414_20100, partial [Thermoanaerobaculia bacterium]